MKWYLLQIVFGSMLIVAWVMSDPVNCELMGRPVMQKEITYVCYSSSMLVLSDDLHPMASSRELPPRQLETSETAWINWTTSASSTGCLDHVPSLMTYNEPATPFGKN